MKKIIAIGCFFLFFLKTADCFDTVYELLFSQRWSQCDDFLSTYSFDLDSYDTDGQTLLCYFVKSNALSAVNYLLVKGAHPNIPNKHGVTPLHYAAKKRYCDVAQKLCLFGADVYRMDNHGDAPVHYMWNSYELARIFIETGALAKFHTTTELPSRIFVCAAGVGNFHVLDALLSAGIDPNTQGDCGITALMRAARSKNIELVKLLARAGADVLMVDESGRTALHYAGTQDILTYLHALKIWREHGHMQIWKTLISWEDWLFITACAKFGQIRKHTDDVVTRALIGYLKKYGKNATWPMISRAVTCAFNKQRYGYLWTLLKHMPTPESVEEVINSLLIYNNRKVHPSKYAALIGLRDKVYYLFGLLTAAYGEVFTDMRIVTLQ